MEQDSGSQDFDATKAELFEAISHPVRIKILEALNEKPMGFAELGRAVGIESGGHLSFHLTKLRHLIRTNSQGDYTLTGEGKEALWTVRALQKSGRETSAVAGRAPLRHRSLLKPVVAVILIAVVVLGGLEFYQQSQFSSLQRQVDSQQGIIGNLEGNIPFVNGEPASLVIGQKDFASNGQAGSLSGLSMPTQALFDNSGDLWIVDFGNSRVLEYKPPFSNGMEASLVLGGLNSTTIVTSGSLSFPSAAAFDSSGNLWISDSGNDRVLEFSPPFHTGMMASLVIGQPNFTSVALPGYPSRDTLSNPKGIAFDSSGRLWVLDSSNNRVLEFNPPFRNGMNASLVLGQPDFDSWAGSSTLSGLNFCESSSTCEGMGGLAVDSSNNVWVGDPGNDRIQEFRPPFYNGMNASLVIDQENLVANGTSFAGHGFVSGIFSLGAAIAFDRQGNLWATYFNMLMAFRPPFVPYIRTNPSLEIGQPNFTTTAWLGGQAGVFNPGQPGFDSHGNLWVPDFNNNRVLEFVANPGAGTAGQIPTNLMPIEYAVASAAAVGVVGVMIAIWFNKRAQKHPSTQSSP